MITSQSKCFFFIFIGRISDPLWSLENENLFALKKKKPFK